MNHLNWGICAFSFLVVTVITSIAISTQPFGFSGFASAGIGLVFFVLAGFVALSLRRIQVQQLVGGFLGLMAGCLLGVILVLIFNAILIGPSSTSIFIRVTGPILLAYIGLVVGISRSDALPFTPSAGDGGPSGKILDTSVLIDGRISDIVGSGFLEGPLIIPQFVLHELQIIADSADSARRARGRRGLDVVQHLQSLPGLKIEVSSQDFVAIHEVDLKLIEFAKLNTAKIVTNDFNLNKLAQVQGIHVLNINELANSLKPVVLPGETMRVFILKEGKEHSQGIAYLDDGTMVVVDNARRMISRNIDMTVTSVLQTTAGKMIFGRYDERSHADHRPISASATS